MSIVELLPALPWLAPFAALPRLAAIEPNLADLAPVSGVLVSVVIPARNEAENIGTVTSSILASTYAPLELLVVDDRSTDDTAAIVGRLAAEDARVRLVSGDALPDGWYGKPWACLQGFHASHGDLILFTDADTRHHPELLGRAVGALGQTGADLVTVAPHQRCETFWERLVMPQVWLLLGLRYHPTTVNRGRRERDVIANGQFILTTRDAYEAIGTHAAVKHEVAEDLALAQTYLRQGRRLYFAFADAFMETRMYRNLAELVEGWAKNMYLGGRRSFHGEPVLQALVPFMMIAAFGFWLLPPAILLLTEGAGALGVAALVATFASVVFWMLVSYGMKIPVYYGLGYPLGAVVALLIAARSIVRGERRVVWRGRTYGGA
ncbi:MAG TPA: glycosyltransferase [Gemmatimonadales bacterium]|jgi:chlorobactene glucosyltransferase